MTRHQTGPTPSRRSRRHRGTKMAGPTTGPSPPNRDSSGTGARRRPFHPVRSINLQHFHTPVGELQFEKIQEKIILISCFDGIGTAALALNDLTSGISLYVSWEIDPDCLAVMALRHPEANSSR